MHARHWHGPTPVGLVNGTDNGHGLILDPQGDATRAQVAVILMRYVKNIVR